MYDNLVLKLYTYGTNNAFFSFLGQKEKWATIDTLLAYIQQNPIYLPFLFLIPSETVDDWPINSPYALVKDRDNADYIYNIEALSQIRGRKYQTIRTHINRFQRQYPSWYTCLLEIDNYQDRQAIKQVYEQWATDKAKNGMFVNTDGQALKRLYTINEHVKLLCLGIYVDGQLVGYTINELQNNGYATNLFEHAMVEFNGIFKNVTLANGHFPPSTKLSILEPPARWRAGRVTLF